MEDNSKPLLQQEEEEYKRFYKLSLWWVEHRVGLRRLGISAFIAFDVIVLLFVAWTFLDTYAVSYDKEQLALAQMVAVGQSDLRAYTFLNSAQPLVEQESRVFSIGEGRYDLYAELVNPNSDWWAEFTYQFVHEGGATEEKVGFILPGQVKYIMELAVDSEVSVRSAAFDVLDVDWRRVDHHTYGTYSDWVTDRSVIEIEEAKFEKVIDGDQVYGKTVFDVHNKTAYSYYDPIFYVLLKKGNALVGVSQVTPSVLHSGQIQSVSLNWFGTLPGVTNVEVHTDIHFLDPSTYKSLEGEATRDTRTIEFN